MRASHFKIVFPLKNGFRLKKNHLTKRENTAQIDLEDKSIGIIRIKDCYEVFPGITILSRGFQLAPL